MKPEPPPGKRKAGLPPEAIVKVRQRKEGEAPPVLARPGESRMPVKDKLRKEQQRISKSGIAQGISFYKEQYKQRMRKIVEISELSFEQADAARRLGNWHIAKPLGVNEMS